MKLAKGFRYAGVASGLKSFRKDLALIVSDVPAAASGAFTVNKAKAAAVKDAEERLPCAGMRAVLVNSGNANALTGWAGTDAVRILHEAVGEALGISPLAVVSASTGVIGVPLPVGKVEAAVPALVKNLKLDPVDAAEAIMTTDTGVKLAWREITIDGKLVTISALCKGSGMIAPQLATMIAVICTDLAITPDVLDDAIEAVMIPSFNMLTVDDDMSTNDAAFILANGMAGTRTIDTHDADYTLFVTALREVCEDLTKLVAADGEGATKVFETKVCGAPTEEIARDLARSICGSNLVKSALFGADPNWGRILATVGARAGSQEYDIDPALSRVAIQDLCVYNAGPVEFDLNALRAKMREPSVRIEVRLAEGADSAVAWGCDLSYDYVKINADYTSMIRPQEDGAMRRDDRLSNYSPQFKVSLLVSALGYISKLRGQRVVIKYGGAAMAKESLRESFCEDVLLLRSVGVVPIIVHGGGPEIARAFERLGETQEFIDGIRVTDADDLKVVEMVMTGQINTELVTALNQGEANAVGISGKDAGMLRARKLVRGDGQDLGHIGELTAVNAELVDVLLRQGYIPVISPMGMGDDGASYNLSGDEVAAGLAVALKAHKLLYLADVAGVLRDGNLVNEISPHDVRRALDSREIYGGMATKAESSLVALAGGVASVHVVDGRVPHTLIGELFTDHGIGTYIGASVSDAAEA